MHFYTLFGGWKLKNSVLLIFYYSSMTKKVQTISRDNCDAKSREIALIKSKYANEIKPPLLKYLFLSVTSFLIIKNS